LTIAEITAAGLASILIPLPQAIDDHQSANARWLEKNKAAILLPQKEMDWKKIASLLTELSADRGRIMAMANAARQLARPDAADDVAGMCLEVARG
jgi:UDP-N-acetylglucosamine--N-acetylmuramyl-(pentapeptide) pyrophosphoryl-undecaprenol N-acetylglucosamine transferase